VHATKPYCISPTYPKICLSSSFDSLKIGQDISFFCFQVKAETSGSNLLCTSSSILSSSRLKRGCRSTSLVTFFTAANTLPVVLSSATVIVVHEDFCLLLSGCSSCPRTAYLSYLELPFVGWLNDHTAIHTVW
jgi:hypothetical protein